MLRDDRLAWTRSIRAAYVSLDEINPGQPGLYYTARELDNMMHWIAEEGYNTVFQQSHHFRLCYPDRWDRITERVAEAVRAAHRYGLRYFEHHSSVIVLDRDAGFAVGGRRLLDMCVQSARAEGPVFLTWPAYERMLCPNNPHYLSLYLDYVKRLIPASGVDGFMCDDAAFCPDTTVCACPYCRQALLGRYGLELPPLADEGFWFNLESASYRTWLRFRQQSIGDYHVQVREFLRTIAPEVAYMTCQASPTDTLLNVTWALPNEELARATDLLFVEVYDTAGRDHRALLDRIVLEYQVIHAMGREYGQPVLALPYCPQGDESYYALALISAFGLMPWMSPDWQSDHLVRHLAQHDDLYREADAVANVAMLWSRSTRDFLGSTSNEAYVGQVQHWLAELMRAHLPCRVVTESDLDRGLGSGCHVLLAPEAACLSDDVCGTIRRFAHSGGVVFATPGSFTRDETGALRDAWAFSDLPVAPSTCGATSHPCGEGLIQVLAARPAELDAEASRHFLDLLWRRAGDGVPVRLEGAPPGLLVTVAALPEGRWVLHLVNLRWQEEKLAESRQTLHVTLGQAFEVAKLAAPGRAEQTLSPVGGRTLAIPVRDLGMYCTVALC